jgi:hypothetical protein
MANGFKYETYMQKLHVSEFKSEYPRRLSLKTCFYLLGLNGKILVYYCDATKFAFKTLDIVCKK